jgi:hypothetical protein
MNELFNSAVWRKLRDEGKLPTIEIELKTETLISLLVGLFLVGACLIITMNIFKKLQK